MTVFLDTSQQEKLVVELRQNGSVMRRIEQTEGFHHAQHLLSALDEVLRQEGVALTELEEVEVFPGPGSYTGTRVGVAVANALAFALGIPVNGQAVGEGVAPVYSGEPKITVKREASSVKG